jgi:hypothetical protein
MFYWCYIIVPSMRTIKVTRENLRDVKILKGITYGFMVLSSIFAIGNIVILTSSDDYGLEPLGYFFWSFALTIPVVLIYLIAAVRTYQMRQKQDAYLHWLFIAFWVLTLLPLFIDMGSA